MTEQCNRIAALKEASHWSSFNLWIYWFVKSCSKITTNTQETLGATHDVLPAVLHEIWLSFMAVQQVWQPSRASQSKIPAQSDHVLVLKHFHEETSERQWRQTMQPWFLEETSSFVWKTVLRFPKQPPARRNILKRGRKRSNESGRSSTLIGASCQIPPSRFSCKKSYRTQQVVQLAVLQNKPNLCCIPSFYASPALQGFLCC